MENWFSQFAGGGIPFGFGGAQAAVPGPQQISPIQRQAANQQGMYNLGYALLNKDKKKKNPFPIPSPMMMGMLQNAYYSNQGMPGAQDGMGGYYNDYRG